MISRVLLLSAVIGWSGSNLLPPEPPKLLSAKQLMEKGRNKQISNLCQKKKKSKKVKELCKKWEQ